MLLLINGSSRTNSTNGAALRAIVEQVPQAQLYQGLVELPHFNPDLDAEPLPPTVATLRSVIGASDALLFSTPEYAGSLPGSLKNLLDWCIGGGELSGKPVGWINVSDRGAAGAYAQLATVLRYADATVVESGCTRIVVSRSDVAGDGTVSDADLRGRLAAAARSLLAAGTAWQPGRGSE
ncbi:MAG TPA: NADPH-dependent FMN reductase [Jatrophihabitans sp.]|nr:NADPH-dependent FMN reductase [Jatrophihabitans sp.]